MPGKSRRKRGKYSLQNKGRKEGSSRLTMPAQQPTAVQTHEPVSSLPMSVPAVSAPTPKAKPPPVWHPYVTTELRTIGILAGIMLIVLVVLALVLS